MTPVLMTSRNRLYLFLLLAILLLTGAWYLWTTHACRDQPLISVSTDQPVYTSQDTIRVTITNQGDRPVDIYCPSVCSLGNFPTTLEKLVDGRWEYASTFCPSIGSPLEQRGIVEGDSIRHALQPEGSFEVALSNLVALHLNGEGRYRIAYYVCGGREPVHSGEFTIGPTSRFP